MNYRNGGIIASPELSIGRPLTWVFCGYDGRVIVYDYYGKVHELSGSLTYEKSIEIDSRCNDNTEFTGNCIDDYKRISSELKAEYGTTFKMSIFNNSDDKQELSLFNLDLRRRFANYGNVSYLEITERENKYSQFLFNVINKPVNINFINVINTSFLDIITLKKTDATGRTVHQPISLSNYVNPYAFSNNIIRIDKQIIIDGNMEVIIGIQNKQALSIDLKNETLTLTY